MPSATVRPRPSQVPWALGRAPTGPVGVWLGASYVLGRPAPVSEPYPHICGMRRPSGARIQERDCAAQHNKQDQQDQPPEEMTSL